MSESEEEKEIILRQWKFDNYARQSDDTTSFVQISEVVPAGGLITLKLTVITNDKPVFEIVADRDQWGTWLTLGVKGEDGNSENAFVAQEDQTISFLDSLIEGLNALKKITIETITPTVIVVNESDLLD